MTDPLRYTIDRTVRRRPPWWRLALLLIVGGVAVAATLGLQRSSSYRGREIAPTTGYTGSPWLARESREAEERTDLLLDALRLRPGMLVADVGAGIGYHAIPMARRVVPGGRVLANDIQPEMLRELRSRADAAGVDNIETVLGSVNDPRLPEGKVDLVLLVDVYHELSGPETILAAIRRSLAPGGRMVLVEFRAEDSEVPIKPEHKMSKQQIMNEIPPNGFVLVESYDELPWQHVMMFQSDEPNAPAGS